MCACMFGCVGMGVGWVFEQPKLKLIWTSVNHSKISIHFLFFQIVNVSLQDDADFECQVGPANYNKPIRAAAHQSVLRKFNVYLYELFI